MGLLHPGRSAGVGEAVNQVLRLRRSLLGVFRGRSGPHRGQDLPGISAPAFIRSLEIPFLFIGVALDEIERK
jgi:hypothetical protein